MNYKKTYVLSLGGSLIVPDSIDIEYLRDFKKFIERKIKNGIRFIIVCGGGATARRYRDAGSGVVKQMPIDDLDWLGIHSTRLNAHLIRTIFRDKAYPKLLLDCREKISKFDNLIAAAAGYWPGHSTDYQAVMFAKKFGADTVVNLSNIDYVYTKDPKKKGAKIIKGISWKEFRKLVGNKWDPGLHAPFDPIASKAAERFKIKAVVLNGANFKNLDNFLRGKSFKGTVIS